MSSPEELNRRVTAVEREVVVLREQVIDTNTLAAHADRDVAEFRVELRAQTRLIGALRETQVEQGVVLNKHSAVLSQHSAVLDQHSAVLDQHSAVLDQHSVTLNQHGVALADIKATLDGQNAELEHIVRLLEGLAESSGGTARA